MVENENKGSGLIKFIGNKQLEENEKKRLPEDIKPLLSNLVSTLHNLWGEAKDAKRPIEEKILKAKRSIEGQYHPNKLAAIKATKGSEAFIRLGARKKRDAYSWIMDILRPSGERLWTLDSTPIPELSPDDEKDITVDVVEGLAAKVAEIAQQTGQFMGPEEFAEATDVVMEDAKGLIEKAIQGEADAVLEKMAAKIEDQMVEGGWFKTFKEVVDDIVTYPAGIIKAPVIRNIPQKAWVQDENGKWEINVEAKITPNFDRVSPWHFYPEGDAGEVNEGYAFERHRLTRKDLNALIGVPGYKDDAIRAVLKEYGEGGLREWLWTDSEKERLENKDWNILQSKRIDALEFWGSIQGKFLREFGLSKKEVPDELLDYEINAWVIGNHVIKAVLNPDKLGKKPYFVTSFEKIPGQIWGKGVPETIEDIEGPYNATARALANNVSIASGPQVEVDVDRIALGADITAIKPWGIWPSTNQQMSSSPAVKFYQPPLHAQNLIQVMEKYERMADSDSGIPSYAHGDPRVGGAGNTASGLSMMMTAAARGIKNVIQNIDMDQIGPVVEQMYDYNMQFDADDSIKGDAKIKVGGSHSVIAREQLALRRKDMLAITANDIDMQIMGLTGREELLRESFKSVELDPDKLIQGGGPQLPSIGGGVGTPPREKTALPGGTQVAGGEQQIVEERGA